MKSTPKRKLLVHMPPLDEPEVFVNGTKLTRRQAMAVRVSCVFLNTHMDHSERDAISEGYLETLEEIRKIMAAPGKTSTVRLVAPLPEHETFQARVDKWVQACFGPEIAADRTERAQRFLEEALELVQAIDMPREDAHILVDYVFDRPKGDPEQEVGGVEITLAALCNAIDDSVNKVNAAEKELDRVWGKIEKIRAKQAAKPKGSPLPE